MNKTESSFIEFKAQECLYNNEIWPVFEKIIERWPKNKKFSVRICLEEAVMNAINWGSKNADSTVKIYYKPTHKFISFSVEDTGKGFDPEKVPDCTKDENLEKPSGRGIYLMREYSDKLKYNKKGNIVTMVIYKKNLNTQSQ